ncbi:MAG: DUF1189 family protein [Candidatus Caenarcaniphilales bacterium]|nr:DUF1189 family protein [Candidatus Caenarcaniphilales bacterium]
MQIEKPRFLQSFWESCWDTSFYINADKASWKHISLHSLVLVLFISISYSVATYVPLTKNLQSLFEDLPEVKIINGKAQFEENVELPKIRKFPQNGNNLYYIVDTGKNRVQLEDEYQIYVLLTKNKIILNDGKTRFESPWKEVEMDLFLKNFFGDPIKFNSNTLARFTSFVGVLAVGCIFFLIVLFLLPLFNFIATFVATIANKWSLDFMSISKLAFFAATPACLIQMVGCFFLGGTPFLPALIGLSWVIQIIYLITGLKELEQSVNEAST